MVAHWCDEILYLFNFIQPKLLESCCVNLTPNYKNKKSNISVLASVTGEESDVDINEYSKLSNNTSHCCTLKQESASCIRVELIRLKVNGLSAGLNS